jgi:hypothetical protein
LVEVSVGQKVLGMPPFSNPPSAITSLLQGVVLGVAVAEAVAVGVGVAGVAVGVGVGVDGVGVGVGVPGVTVGLGVGVAQMPLVLMLKLHPPVMVPTSPPRSSTTYRLQVPFGFSPLKAANVSVPHGAPSPPGLKYGPAGAGAANGS